MINCGSRSIGGRNTLVLFADSHKNRRRRRRRRRGGGGRRNWKKVEKGAEEEEEVAKKKQHGHLAVCEQTRLHNYLRGIYDVWFV